MEELKKAHEINLEQVLKENAQLIADKDEEIQSLNKQLNEMIEEQKEKELENMELKSEIYALQKRLINPDEYLEWNHEQILQWIMLLDNGRYKKYKTKLAKHLMEEEVNGGHLSKVNILDIKGWGVTNFDDKKDLMESIKQLISGNNVIGSDKEGVSTVHV